jgi:catechol 2,3-dioxygenase-like lactoylglutathione lyase family enzyme
MRALTDHSLNPKEGSMRPMPDPKTMAKTLRASLRQRQIDIPHSAALEIVAAQHGLDNWNILAAMTPDAASPDAVRFGQTCPVMRIFDEAKAREFYVEFLGFNLDWEHRFGENFPLYAQVSRAGLSLHLSGHHGDASPGSTAFVRMEGVHAYQKELARKNYSYGKPGVEDMPWGLVMTVTDPFSNRIRFCQGKAEA